MTVTKHDIKHAAQDEDVRLVRESANDLLRGLGGLSRMREQRFTTVGFDRNVWSRLCEMGWLGMRVAEDAGGSGMGMRAAVQVGIAAGTYLLPEPLIGGMTASRLLRGDAQAQQISGEKIYLPAWQETANSLDSAQGNTRFVDGKVSGVKRFVWQGCGADGFVISTPQGCALVQAGTASMSIRATPLQDGGHWAEVECNEVPAIALAGGDIEEALDEAALLESAYLLGSAQAAFSMTLEYMRSRRQFDKPIGSFQALQHRAADLRIAIALAEASVENAARVIDAGEHKSTRQLAVSRAKARCSDTALLVTRQAVQLHGAIGYTDEYDVGLFLRSAMCHAAMAGSSAVHRERFGRMCD